MVLLDIRLPGISGMEVLRKALIDHHNTATIMLTAVNDVDTAVEAMKLGASDYIVKPFNLDRVSTSIGTAYDTKGAASKSSAKMDAIASGVEARLNLLFGFSKTVTQETVDIARRLDIPGKEIQRWAATRARLESENNKTVISSLDKLQRNPLAQHMLGMTALHQPPNISESRN